MIAERHAPPDQLARAVDRAVYASLRPVLASLALLFFMFAVSHPLVLEPAFGLTALSGLWTIGFAVLALALAACFAAVLRAGPAAASRAITATRPSPSTLESVARYATATDF